MAWRKPTPSASALALLGAGMVFLMLTAAAARADGDDAAEPERVIDLKDADLENLPVLEPVVMPAQQGSWTIVDFVIDPDRPIAYAIAYRMELNVGAVLRFYTYELFIVVFIALALLCGVRVWRMARRGWVPGKTYCRKCTREVAPRDAVCGHCKRQLARRRRRVTAGRSGWKVAVLLAALLLFANLACVFIYHRDDLSFEDRAQRSIFGRPDRLRDMETSVSWYSATAYSLAFGWKSLMFEDDEAIAKQIRATACLVTVDLTTGRVRDTLHVSPYATRPDAENHRRTFDDLQQTSIFQNDRIVIAGLASQAVLLDKERRATRVIADTRNSDEEFFAMAISRSGKSGCIIHLNSIEVIELDTDSNKRIVGTLDTEHPILQQGVSLIYRDLLGVPGEESIIIETSTSSTIRIDLTTARIESVVLDHHLWEEVKPLEIFVVQEPEPAFWGHEQFSRDLLLIDAGSLEDRGRRYLRFVDEYGNVHHPMLELPPKLEVQTAVSGKNWRLLFSTHDLFGNTDGYVVDLQQERFACIIKAEHLNKTTVNDEFIWRQDRLLITTWEQEYFEYHDINGIQIFDLGRYLGGEGSDRR